MYEAYFIFQIQFIQNTEEHLKLPRNSVFHRSRQRTQELGKLFGDVRDGEHMQSTSAGYFRINCDDSKIPAFPEKLCCSQDEQCCAERAQAGQ